MSVSEICHKEISRFFGGGISPHLTYRLIILLSLAEIVLMLFFPENIGYEVPDTVSYYNAFGNIRELTPNRMRPPIYPLLYGGLCSLMGDTGGRLLTVGVQIALFLGSLGALRASCGLLWNNSKLTYWVVAFYALYPPAPSIACSLISEGVAMPLTVILICLVLLAIKRPSWPRAVSIGLLTIVLIFTRTSFVFLLVFIPLGWIILLCLLKKKKTVVVSAVTGILMSLAGWMVVSVYMARMEKEYGIYVLTDVAAANNYFLLRETGAIDPQTAGNPHARKLIENYITRQNVTIPEVTRELWNLSSHLSAREFDTMVDTNVRMHKEKILRGLIERTYRVSLSHLTYLNPENPFSIMIAPFNINFGTYFILMLLTIIIVVRQTVRHHHFPPATFFLWAFSLSMTIVAIVGAMNDWARLVVSGQCIWLLLAASLLNILKVKRCLPLLH